MGRSSATLPAAATSPRVSSNRPDPPPREGYRDTVEAVVVAFILALVFRGFQAQAFVIPTGSMAPTLMGRHKEVACPQCGFVYAVNASDEVEPRSGHGNYLGDVASGICVNCRYQNRSLEEQPSFKGDRILVMMFPYDLPFLPFSHAPERWDVVVFRYPEEPEVSYIKRLVGLPGEMLRIAHGDVYVKTPGATDFVLARKPLRHQSAMQINVYDDRYPPRALADMPEWTRWRTGSAWTSALAKSLYRTEASGDSWSELRYHHLPPDPEQWDAILSGRESSRPPRPTLITDFYSYDTNLSAAYSDLIGEQYDEQKTRYAWMQPHWVGDLTLESAIEIKQVSPGGSIRWELVKAGVAHRCTIDLMTGVATFTRGEDVLGQAETTVKGTGRHRVEVANVDDRMTLVIDGQAVNEPGFAYDSGEANPIPTERDLAPAALAVRNATVEASDLVLKRDIYYTQSPGDSDYDVVWDDRSPRTPTELFDFLSDPSRFPALGRLRYRDYEIGQDRFFMMGDNSPRSKDSRGWGRYDRTWDETSDRKAWEVPRHYLTGKAFYIYWPHGVPFWPALQWGRDFRFPFRPHIERMKWIR
jgi:signal peptidase I